jgi:hypothetical protein
MSFEYDDMPTSPPALTIASQKRKPELNSVILYLDDGMINSH